MKNKKLELILHYEAKEAENGAIASKLRGDYLQYSKYKKGSILELTLRSDKIVLGKISRIKFDTHSGFIYYITPLNKDLSNSIARMANYVYNSIAFDRDNQEVRSINLYSHPKT